MAHFRFHDKLTSTSRWNNQRVAEQLGRKRARHGIGIQGGSQDHEEARRQWSHRKHKQV